MEIYVQPLDDQHYILVNSEGEMVDRAGNVVRVPVLVTLPEAAEYMKIDGKICTCNAYQLENYGCTCEAASYKIVDDGQE